ncbi:MAG TPA: N-6 DNA methylase [Rhodanobacteraceae bacterium]|nr:N-6 DNA methylase [Rhodanobacteraceae bacterium]
MTKTPKALDRIADVVLAYRPNLSKQSQKAKARPAKSARGTPAKATASATSEPIHSEEDVKFKFLVPYLESIGYKRDCIAFNVAVQVQEGRKKKTIYADAIVYTTKEHKAPLIVCETKSPTEILDRAAREQAISYARLLPRIAPLALLTNSTQTQVFHTLHKTRRPELPRRDDLEADIVKFVLDKNIQETLREEAKHDLFIIDDVTTFKTILKSCHNEIRNNEGLDPTAAFDEMSKVMFCKLFEEKENPQGNRFRLAVFDDSMERLKFNVVRKIFDDARAHPSYSGLFQKDAQINLRDRTIRRIVGLFENYDLGLTAFDVKGEAFEFFLGDTFTGGLGEYFTPRNVVEFMVEAINPKIGERIIDPFCGTGGFLIFAFELVSEKIRLQEFADAEKLRWRLELSSRCLYGTDWKERTSQACKMNMMVHGDGSSGVFMHDGFTDIDGLIADGLFDICLTNPPFGSMESDSTVLNRYELGSGRNSQDRVILSLERSLRLVKPGGAIGIVVIDGVLNNSRTQYVRDYLRHHAWIKAVISLNKETFEGYGARAKTSVLILCKKETANDEPQKPVFMAIARNTGLAPNGSLVSGNVLPDILLDYRSFERGDAVGLHSESWTTKVDDRLDAEFYAQGSARTVTDMASLRLEAEATQRKIALAQEAMSDLDRVFAELRTVPVRLGDVLDETSVREKLDPDKLYRLLGVRWWGEGAFEREQKLGREVKATSAFRVSAGWIIYNRLFAYKGSFAMTGSEHDGCYVSGEFPTFSAKDPVNGDLLCRYIVHCLNSPQYLSIVNAQSTGSTKTSRNRFNQKLFLSLKIQVPESVADLEIVVRLLDRSSELRALQERQLELAKGLREGVYGLLPTPS